MRVATVATDRGPGHTVHTLPWDVDLAAGSWEILDGVRDLDSLAAGNAGSCDNRDGAPELELAAGSCEIREGVLDRLEAQWAPPRGPCGRPQPLLDGAPARDPRVGVGAADGALESKREIREEAPDFAPPRRPL